MPGPSQYNSRSTFVRARQDDAAAAAEFDGPRLQSRILYPAAAAIPAIAAAMRRMADRDPESYARVFVLRTEEIHQTLKQPRQLVQ